MKPWPIAASASLAVPASRLAAGSVTELGLDDGAADVETDAKTTGTGPGRRFVDEANEAKPREWTMCFGAGPEVPAAVRGFAEQWLAELP